LKLVNSFWGDGLALGFELVNYSPKLVHTDSTQPLAALIRLLHRAPSYMRGLGGVVGLTQSSISQIKICDMKLNHKS